MTKWLETDTNTNIDISGVTSIGSYTANADKSILVQAFLNQIAGNGDYLCYVTIQINGTGANYGVSQLSNTVTVPAGVTSIGFQFPLLSVRSGDVILVAVDGLAGDTTTPDTIVRWFELDNALPVTLAKAWEKTWHDT